MKKSRKGDFFLNINKRFHYKTTTVDYSIKSFTNEILSEKSVIKWMRELPLYLIKIINHYKHTHASTLSQVLYQFELKF